MTTRHRATLEIIQHTALSICCSALRGTRMAGLQVDCGEMHLHLRRRQQMMEYTTKIQSISEHPTQSILKVGKRRRVKKGREEIRVKVAEVGPIQGDAATSDTPRKSLNTTAMDVETAGRQCSLYFFKSECAPNFLCAGENFWCATYFYKKIS